ncbi:hypothetical protein [Streptomyces sp. TRM68416]|nr:hypothetical protein [Streptomyces sp. TRM68416]
MRDHPARRAAALTGASIMGPQAERLVQQLGRRWPSMAVRPP